MNQANWLLWEGREVEGRLLGVPTLFIREVPSDHAGCWRSYAHVWFCKEFCQSSGYELIKEVLDAGIMASVELTTEMLSTVPHDVLSRAHLVLAIPAPSLDKLKPSDTVRLDTAPFTIYTATKHNLQHTVPHHYRGDRKIA